jgi:prolipoprotein diacylglyceryltransferase
MDIFSLFFLFFFFFLALYLTIYILGIIMGYIPTKKITRNRKRLKKISINSIIIREVFNG